MRIQKDTFFFFRNGGRNILIKLYQIINILHKYLVPDKLNHEFLQYFIVLLMNEPSETHENDIKDDNDNYYPCSNYNQRRLNVVYRGERELNRAHARTILAHLNRSKLIDAIYDLDYDAREILHSDINNLGIVCSLEDMEETITEVVVKLINAIANGKKGLNIDEITNDNCKNVYQNISEKNIYSEDMDEDIIRVLKKLISECNQSELIVLNKNPVAVKNKIPREEAIFRNYIVSLINMYYTVIEEMFKQYQDEGMLRYDLLCSYVKIKYNIYRKNNTEQSHEQIFEFMVQWLKRLTNESSLACSIVIAYFVQNCEVFDDISGQT